MRKKNYRSGVTLVELLVSLLIATVLVLTIGAISEISLKSYTKNRQRISTISDIYYGFKVVQKHIREAKTITQITSASLERTEDQLTVNSWQTPSKAMELDNGLIGVFRSVPTQSSYLVPMCEFVYIPDKTKAIDSTNKDILIQVEDPGNSCSTLRWSILCDTTNCLNPRNVTVNIKGTKNNLPFNISTKIYKRIK